VGEQEVWGNEHQVNVRGNQRQQTESNEQEVCNVHRTFIIPMRSQKVVSLAWEVRVRSVPAATKSKHGVAGNVQPCGSAGGPQQLVWWSAFCMHLCGLSPPPMSETRSARGFPGNGHHSP
jgi:hypothetical protein